LEVITRKVIVFSFRVSRAKSPYPSQESPAHIVVRIKGHELDYLKSGLPKIRLQIAEKSRPLKAINPLKSPLQYRIRPMRRQEHPLIKQIRTLILIDFYDCTNGDISISCRRDFLDDLQSLLIYDPG